ncbi:Lrp/AsnC family transcriptional regulator [Oxalobacteraceae bacterium A2-2]
MNSHAITIDKFDLELLAQLQRDGLATNSALGEKIHLSSSQVSRRIQRMQEAGLIDHYCVVLDAGALGLDVTAFTEVTLDHNSSSAAERFEREVQQLEPVLECYTLAGQADYLLRIVAADLATLSEFMTGHILRIPGVANVRSTITLRRVKHTHALPLAHVTQPVRNRKRVLYTS